MKLLFSSFLLSALWLVQLPVQSQDALLGELRGVDWDSGSLDPEGLSWGVFSRQYYSLINWNCSGTTLSYRRGGGASLLALIRDGIPGDALWQVIISHRIISSPISGLVSLRAGLYVTPSSPVVWQLGGDIALSGEIGERTTLCLFMHDLNGFFADSLKLHTRDPSFRIQMIHRAGRLADGFLGTEVGADQFGPIRAGVRIHPAGDWWFDGVVSALPGSFSFGISYRFESIRVTARFQFGSQLGITPLCIFQGPIR